MWYEEVFWSTLKTWHNYVWCCLFMNKDYIPFYGKWPVNWNSNQSITSCITSLTPSLSLMLILAPSLISCSIVNLLPSLAAVCMGVCWERESLRHYFVESYYVNSYVTFTLTQKWHNQPSCSSVLQQVLQLPSPLILIIAQYITTTAQEAPVSFRVRTGTCPFTIRFFCPLDLHILCLPPLSGCSTDSHLDLRASLVGCGFSVASTHSQGKWMIYPIKASPSPPPPTPHTHTHIHTPNPPNFPYK